MMMKKLHLFGVLLFLLSIATPALGDHISSKSPRDLENGGLIESKSFKSNWFVYKSIGGNTSVKSKVKKRKWWCAWLCKRRKDKKAELIQIQNTYFAKFDSGLFSEPIVEAIKQCRNAASCTDKKSAGGILPSISFPGDFGSIEIVGVVTRHTITVDGQSFTALTAKGDHPDVGPVIVD